MRSIRFIVLHIYSYICSRHGVDILDFEHEDLMQSRLALNLM